MNNSLVKLVDATLLPAAILVVGKVLGLAITIAIFQLPWDLIQTADGFGLSSVTPAVKLEHLVTVSTYSDLFMFLVIAAGFSTILFRATFLNQQRIKPHLLIKLSNANLLGLLKSSYDIYHYASIWLIFVWVASFTIAINTLMGKTALWLLITVVISAITFTTILLQDVYKEIAISRKSLGGQIAF
jgi:hypothetical protein